MLEYIYRKEVDMKTNKEKKKKISLSVQAEKLFLACLPIILVVLIALFIGFLDEYERYPQYAAAVYPPMFEYIMMSLAILLGGAMFVDYIVKNNS